MCYNKCMNCYKCGSLEDLRQVAKNRNSLVCKPCHNARVKSYYDKQKALVFKHYGAYCGCCDEDMFAFLSIDHVNNNGNKDFNANGNKLRGRHLYAKIVKLGFPSDYQVLCMNCNFGKHVNDGVCPHKVLDKILYDSV